MPEGMMENKFFGVALSGVPPQVYVAPE